MCYEAGVCTVIFICASLGFIFCIVGQLCYVMTVYIVWQYGFWGTYLGIILSSCALCGEFVGWGCVHTLRGTSVYCGTYLWVVG